MGSELCHLLFCVQGIKSETQTIKTKQKLLPANWPTDGSITFEDVETVQAPGFVQGLQGMSFTITTGQKIGELSLSCLQTQVAAVHYQRC
jgi:hypothetical protein